MKPTTGPFGNNTMIDICVSGVHVLNKTYIVSEKAMIVQIKLIAVKTGEKLILTEKEAKISVFYSFTRAYKQTDSLSDNYN